ncbi:MAG: hypothetical protein P1U67_13505 [Alcanivoracaceae bacterium]|nr:hypothetical protein [Alcanivoracaceae bacterium]
MARNRHHRNREAKRDGALVKICVFTVEGLLSHPRSDAERQKICRELLP